MDRVSSAARSKLMASVGQKNTGPEMAVRRPLHSRGFRYRLHRKDLPGKPDLVFPVRKKVIFVHGCFWHGHECSKGRLPKCRVDYWKSKIEKNIFRDQLVICELNDLGWSVFVVWQCQLGQIDILSDELLNFLDG